MLAKAKHAEGSFSAKEKRNEKDFIYRSVLQREKVKVEDRVMELSQRIING